MSNIKAYFFQLSSAWQRLSKREQLLSTAGGSFLFIALIINGVLNPLTDGRDNARQQLENNRTLHAEVIAGAEKIQTLQANGAALPLADMSRPMDERVRLAAQASSIAIHRLTSQQNSLQVVLGEVPFEALISWLTRLELQGISVRSLQINQTIKPGIVSVDQLRLVESERS